MRKITGLRIASIHKLMRQYLASFILLNFFLQPLQAQSVECINVLIKLNHLEPGKDLTQKKMPPYLKPDLPKGAKKIEEADHYIIYETSTGERHILFDSRYAYARTITHELNWTEGTSASTFTKKDTGTVAVLVNHGLHRAVGTAAHSDQVSLELGGTTTPYWLDYWYWGYQDSLYRDPSRLRAFTFDRNQLPPSAR